MSTDPRDRRPDAPDPDALLREQRALERRAFLRQAGIIGLAAAGSAWAGLAPSHWPLSLKDPDGERGKPREKLLRLPEGGFAVEPSTVLPTLGIARGADIDAMVRAAVNLIGGIDRFIQRDDVVVIKPNVAFERVPVLGATTSPEVLKAVVRLVREAHPKEIRVADNPIESPENCFMRTGIRQAAIDVDARVYLPSPGDFRTLHVPGATYIEEWPFFHAPFRNATKVIGLAPVKDHNLCRASMSTKNWYGLLGGRRNQFHQDIHGIISDLALMLRPTFVILDGSRVMFKSGPTGGSLGDVREGNGLVASTDTLAADAWGWDQMLERTGETKPDYLAQAESRGLGNPDWRNQGYKEEQVG